MVKSFSSADLRGNPLGGREAALDEVDIVTIYKRATTVTVTIDPTTVTIVPRQTYVP